MLIKLFNISEIPDGFRWTTVGKTAFESKLELGLKKIDQFMTILNVLNKTLDVTLSWAL